MFDSMSLVSLALFTVLLLSTDLSVFLISSHTLSHDPSGLSLCIVEHYHHHCSLFQDLLGYFCSKLSQMSFKRIWSAPISPPQKKPSF